MTTPKRPETIADLPHYLRTLDAVNVTLPAPSVLLEHIPAAEDLREALALLRRAFRQIHGASVAVVVNTGHTFHVRVPRSEDAQAESLRAAQLAWDREHSLDDTKIGGSE